MKDDSAIPLQSHDDNKCVIDAVACTPGYQGRIKIVDKVYVYRSCPSHFKEAVDAGKVKHFVGTLENAIRKELGLPELAI